MIDQYIYTFQWGVLAIILCIGIVLVFMSPYWAFLFAVFMSISMSQTTVTYTRTEELGAYFNLYDACLIVAILALVWDQKKSFALPKPAMALLLVLLMGFFNSMLTLGFTYGGLRALRWAVTLPLYFILAANLVRGKARVKALLLTLILGAVAAELQHMAMVIRYRGVADNPDLLRTIKFYVAGSDAWLLAGPYLVEGCILHPLIQMGIGGLFFLANISHQTRSVALGFMGGLLVYVLCFLRGPNSFRLQRLKGFVFLALLGIFLVAITGFSGLAERYAERLAGTFSGNEAEAPIDDRLNALKLETQDWLEGNVLIGRGLDYFQIHGKELIKFNRKGGVAFGHLGYVTYLSQLGLIGFLVYAVYFPFAVIFRSRRIMQTPDISPVVAHLAALTGACFILQAVTFLFSSSYLITWIVPGVLAGAVWALSREDLATSQVLAEMREG